jgi:hypothetical protein
MGANTEQAVAVYDVFAAKLDARNRDEGRFFEEIAVENKARQAQAAEIARFADWDWIQLVQLLPAGVDAGRLAWLRLIEVEFTLIRNLTTRDGPSYYPSNNPIYRDVVFKCPVMPGSSWKGAIRASAREQEAELRVLFGPEKDEPEPHNEARLHCLPTFFTVISRDILNPRNRKTRAGSAPINLEVIAAGTIATLQMIWSPFDLLGGTAEEIEKAWQADWKIVRVAVAHMFDEGGVGAKKSLSFGLAKDLKWRLNGIIQTES